MTGPVMSARVPELREPSPACGGGQGEGPLRGPRAERFPPPQSSPASGGGGRDALTPTLSRTREREVDTREGEAASEPAPFGIYIHWPFCLSKCPYCDFNSHVR